MEGDETNYKSYASKKKQVNSQQENATLIGLNGRKNVYVPDNAKHIFIAGTTGSGKTVALSNFIQHGIEKSFPLLVIDGKGDIGAGSILEITKQFCREYKKKLYIVNLSEPEQSSKYNPFANASPTACKDMLINLTDWSEQHYKSNSERFFTASYYLVTAKQYSAIISNNHQSYEYRQL